MKLRPYQILAGLDAKRVWRGGVRGVVLCLPTGAGKTVTAYNLVAGALASGERVLWLAHVDVLLSQSVATAAAYGHGDVGIIKAGWSNPDAQLQIGSMQTLGRRLRRIAAAWTPDLIVVDECHRALCATYGRILEAWPGARVLGLTATPWRTDGKGLEGAFGSIVSPTSPDMLVRSGHLVPPSIAAVPLISTKGMHKRGGEFRAAEVDAACKPGLGDVAKHVVKALYSGWAPGLAFCGTVGHSVALRDELRRRGIRAEHVDASTDSSARDDLLGPGGGLASGAVQVVCSVGVLDEGVDCPDVRLIALAAPTAASSRYLQRVGRGLRPAAGKVTCRVLDFGGHIDRFWHPLEDMRAHYSLSGAPDAGAVRESVADAVRTCADCFAVFRRSAWPSGPCVACGVEPYVAPVKVEETGAAMVERKRGDVVAWADKNAHWSGLVETCMARGYKAGWAMAQYKRRFGYWPSKGQQSALRFALARVRVSA